MSLAGFSQLRELNLDLGGRKPLRAVIKELPALEKLRCDRTEIVFKKGLSQEVQFLQHFERSEVEGLRYYVHHNLLRYCKLKDLIWEEFEFHILEMLSPSKLRIVEREDRAAQLMDKGKHLFPKLTALGLELKIGHGRLIEVECSSFLRSFSFKCTN